MCNFLFGGLLIKATVKTKKVLAYKITIYEESILFFNHTTIIYSNTHMFMQK